MKLKNLKLSLFIWEYILVGPALNNSSNFDSTMIIQFCKVPWFASTATLVPWAAPVARGHPRTALSMLYAC